MCPPTTRLWCTELLLPPILIIPIPIRAMCPELPWHGARELRWGLLPGALGAAIGAIAIGTVATLRSTTIIITIRTTISTATSVARGKGIGSTIRNTAAMPPMGTGRRRISLAVRVRVEQVIDQVVWVAPVVPEDPVVRAGLAELAAQVALVEQVVQVDREALA